MFSVATRKELIRQLRHPLRLKDIRARAHELMRGTRYRSADNFITALKNEGILQVHTLEAKNGRNLLICCSTPLTDVDAYELACSVLPGGYFCNLTAIYHHSLTNQVPNTVYWCHETIVPRKTQLKVKLSESSIRGAFLKPQRHTSFIVQHADHDIVIIDRARGSDYGIVKIERQRTPCPAGSRVASLERALIDAVVAPHYNGGLTSLCDYFRAARDKLDVARMLNIYRKLDFVYPYAQVLGFFMQHCGMQSQADDIRGAYPPTQRFYVDHGAKTTWVYDARWMLFYPKGLIHEY